MLSKELHSKAEGQSSSPGYLKQLRASVPSKNDYSGHDTQTPDRRLGSPVAKASSLINISSKDPISVHQTYFARHPSMASSNQQKSTFLPLSPTRSAPSASPPASPTISKTQSPGTNNAGVAGDIVVPFGRDRSDSNASAASANSYLWLSTAKKD